MDTPERDEPTVIGGVLALVVTAIALLLLVVVARVFFGVAKGAGDAAEDALDGDSSGTSGEKERGFLG